MLQGLDLRKTRLLVYQWRLGKSIERMDFKEDHPEDYNPLMNDCQRPYFHSLAF